MKSSSIDKGMIKGKCRLERRASTERNERRYGHEIQTHTKEQLVAKQREKSPVTPTVGTCLSGVRYCWENDFEYR